MKVKLRSRLRRMALERLMQPPAKVFEQALNAVHGDEQFRVLARFRALEQRLCGHDVYLSNARLPFAEPPLGQFEVLLVRRQLVLFGSQQLEQCGTRSGVRVLAQAVEKPMDVGSVNEAFKSRHAGALDPQNLKLTLKLRTRRQGIFLRRVAGEFHALPQVAAVRTGVRCRSGMFLEVGGTARHSPRATAAECSANPRSSRILLEREFPQKDDDLKTSNKRRLEDIQTGGLLQAFLRCRPNYLQEDATGNC